MNTINQFFLVQHLVSQYRDACFLSSYPYEKRAENALVVSICLVTLSFILASFILMSETLMIWGIGLAGLLFLYTKFNNSRLVKFARKRMALLVWEIQIEKKILQLKSDAHFRLYEFKNVIHDMSKSTIEWQRTAQEAKNILEFR